MIAPGTGDLSLAMLSPRGQNLLGMLGLFSLDSLGEVTQALAAAGRMAVVPLPAVGVRRVASLNTRPA